MCRPHDTPFEDGTFKLTLVFTEEYPNKPPTVRFISKMFHPNGNLSFFFFFFSTLFGFRLITGNNINNHFSYSVYADGGICLDILQNRWSPTYDVSAILTSIQVIILCITYNYKFHIS